MAPNFIARKTIEVAAGVITDAQGRVLLMQRLPGKHLAGLWEFPGGKLEAGESVARALARELDEELGIEVCASAPLIALPWRYPEKTVHLHALRVTAWRGEPCAREGHPLRWVALRDIDTAEMPAADVAIVAALRLPPYYAIGSTRVALDAGLSHSGPHLPHPDPLPHAQHGGEGENGGVVRMHDRLPLPQAAASLGGEGWDEGALVASTLWQLRMPGASRDEVKRVALHALAVEPRLRRALLVNHDVELARELGVGVHLRATQLRELSARPLPRDCWVGASCHTAEELELAARLGVDFATLSPVCPTASHPDAGPLGWDRFAKLVADARVPVYALGGVGPDDMDRARAAGAQGVAGIRAFA